MKKITFILFALIAGTGFAQTNIASATVDVDVVSVITIQKDVDLNFGKIISDVDGGTVIINLDSSRGAGTANYVTTGAIPTAASFTIAAETGYYYSIAYTSSATLAGPSGSVPMGVVYSYSLPTANNLGGTDTNLLVGGTLSVGSNQLVGNYTGSVEVTVAYE